MKIRNGFVSNSSSSSFIVTIPENFIITDKIIKKLDYDDAEPEEIKAIIEKFIEDGDISSYEEDYYDRDEDEKICSYDVIYALYSKVLKDYTICEVQGGSDSPSNIELVPYSILKKLVKKLENYEG